MTAPLCARGLHAVEPGRACASCAARNVAPEQWATSAPARAPGAFVVAPRVAPAPARRCDPLPPVRTRFERYARVESPCITGCGGVSVDYQRGPAPAPGTERMCLVCRKAETPQRRKNGSVVGVP